MNDVARPHLAKIQSLLLSPYDDTLFLDADTRPCRSLEQLFELLGDMNFDVMITQNVKPGFKRLGDVLPGVPLGWPEVNSGVMLVKTDKPNVRDVIEEWKRKYREGGVEHDQPSLRAVLYEATRDERVTMYVLPAIWNMRAWRKFLVYPTLPATISWHQANRCCFNATFVDIIIDHKCK